MIKVDDNCVCPLLRSLRGMFVIIRYRNLRVFFFLISNAVYMINAPKYNPECNNETTISAYPSQMRTSSIFVFQVTYLYCRGVGQIKKQKRVYGINL